MNVSSRGTYGTIGIPGTGVSLRHRVDRPGATTGKRLSWIWVAGIGLMTALVIGALLSGVS